MKLAEGQDFDALPTDEEIMYFIRELGLIGEINSLNDVIVDQMHQPWRTFAALINKSLSRNTTGLDKLCLSRSQILWGYELPPSLIHFLCQTFQRFQRHASHTKLFDQEIKSISWQRLGDDVSQLVFSPDKV
ncbi:hypothetical protein Tco_0963932 [Tanacetum coccineum]